MTEYPTRRALREAQGRKRSRRSDARPAGTATPSARSRARIAAAASAVLLVAGSAVVAEPATAATPTSRTVLASELLDAAQSLTVAADVTQTNAKLTEFDAARAATTGSAAAPVLTVGGLTNADWAALVLQEAGLPVTQNNVTVMLQWMDSENSPRHWWLRNNPLNNGLGSGGGSGFGSYADLRIAAQYVAKQLDRALFSGIAAALQADSPPAVTAQAIMASAWAGGHYDYGRLWHAVDVPIVAAPASAW